MRHIIGSVSFNSIKEIESHVQDLLVRNENLIINKGEDFLFLLELIKRHPNVDEKVSNGIRFFIVIRNMGMHRALSIVDNNYKVSSISFKKCCAPKSFDNYNINIAMRSSIKYQTDSFKELNLELPFLCPLCKKVVNLYNNVHVDHVVKFKDLSSEFISKYGSHPKEFVKKSNHDPVCFKEGDYNFSLEWEKFHKDNAVFRLICSTCNIKNL